MDANVRSYDTFNCLYLKNDFVILCIIETTFEVNNTFRQGIIV